MTAPLIRSRQPRPHASQHTALPLVLVWSRSCRPCPYPPSPTTPCAPLLIRRIRADPQQPGDPHGAHVLAEQLRGLQPHPLPAEPALRGQPATIRIPHDTGLNPPAPLITQAPTLTNQTKTSDLNLVILHSPSAAR